MINKIVNEILIPKKRISLMQLKFSSKAKEENSYINVTCRLWENYIAFSTFYLMHCICGGRGRGGILAVELLPKPQKGCATKSMPD